MITHGLMRLYVCWCTSTFFGGESVVGGGGGGASVGGGGGGSKGGSGVVVSGADRKRDGERYRATQSLETYDPEGRPLAASDDNITQY
jgi:hypothetical protein